MSVSAAGMRGIAGAQMEAASRGTSTGKASDSALAAQAPAPLAAAPEQALKAEASEAASEPELLFAPDFIISQVGRTLETFCVSLLHTVLDMQYAYTPHTWTCTVLRHAIH